MVAMSTMEAKYIAMFMAGRQAARIRQIFEAVYHLYTRPLKIFCNNQAAIAITKGEGTHEASKHINIKFHYVKELVETQKVLYIDIPTTENDADILTKCVDGATFVKAIQEYNFTGVDNYLASTSPSNSPLPDVPNPDNSSLSVEQFHSFAE